MIEYLFIDFWYRFHYLFDTSKISKSDWLNRDYSIDLDLIQRDMNLIERINLISNNQIIISKRIYFKLNRNHIDLYITELWYIWLDSGQKIKKNKK